MSKRVCVIRLEKVRVTKRGLDFTMTIEVGYFPDKMLKVIRNFKKGDSNVRIEGDRISVVSRLEEVRLENEVISACDLHNLRKRFPELDIEIKQILKRYFGYNCV